MISKTKKITKVFATMVAIFMLISNLGLTLTGLSKLSFESKKVLAYEEVNIANASFTEPNISSNTTLPANPSNWTAKDKSEDITSGVITLDTEIVTDEKITNSYKLSTLPRKYTGMQDNQILMINAKTSYASSGYASGTISLESGNYYVITFRAYTEKGTTASAKLTGNTELEANENVYRLNTNATWKQYKFYVQTNNSSSTSAQLEFWLGVEGENQSKGAAFFDDVQISKFDNQTFTLKLKNDMSSKANYKFINLDKHYVENFVENASFESALSASNWTLIDKSSLKSASETINGRFDIANFSKEDTGVNADITNTTVAGNQYALLINNLESGYVGYKSAYFTVEEKALYKLSFVAKSGSLTGSATVNLVERNPYTNQKMSNGTDNPLYYANSSYKEQTFSITSITTSGYSNSLTNDWKTYTFYIQGNNLIDTEVNLELWLGTESANAKGYIFFDNFTLQKITTSEFDANSSNGTIANLNQNTTATDFENGTFNLVEIQDVEDTYPYTPKSWTLTKTNENALAKNGIINTKNNNSALGVPAIPSITTHSNNNVLMIGNIASNNQKYTSSVVKLAVDKYAKITIDVLTTDLINAKASIKVVSNSTTIGEILNIDTNGEWQTITILIHSSFEETPVSLELGLGEDGTGFAFFDNVIYKNNLTEEDYTTIEADKKIDLTKYDWTSTRLTETSGVFEPTDWTVENTQDTGIVTAGVIDSTKFGTDEGYNETSYDAPGHPESTNENILMIKSTDDTYYTYKSTLTRQLTSGNYYKIEVLVKTDRLGQNSDNIVYKDSANRNAYPFGASIDVDGIEANFIGIDTDGEWKTYTIYINCTTSSSINLKLSLGSKNAKTKGAAYFSTASISQIEESDYRSGISVLENDSTIDNILAVGNTDAEESTEIDETETNNNTAEFNWLVVPSLITGLAILYAIVGAIWRTVKKNSPKKARIQKPYSKENLKKLANSHKREIENLKQKIQELQKRQNEVAIELNNARLENNASVERLEAKYAEINNKIDALSKQKQEFNQKYKQKVAELKTMKKADER